MTAATTAFEAKSLAALLWRAWSNGEAVGETEAVTAPPTAQDAYAVQEAFLKLSGWPVTGWKVGAKGPGDLPQAAPIPARLILPSPVGIDGTAMRMIGIEAEIAYCLGRDLPPRHKPYAEDEVMDAIEAVLPVVEVLDTRLADWDAAHPLLRLADNQSNGFLVTGPQRLDWPAVDPQAQRIQLLVDGQAVKEVTGGNPAGNPLPLVAWLANAVQGRGRFLRKGDVVTTGSCTGVAWVRPGAEVVAKFPGLGSVALKV